MRQEWNAPFNKIRRGKNKELKEKLIVKKESEGGEADEGKDSEIEGT